MESDVDFTSIRPHHLPAAERADLCTFARSRFFSPLQCLEGVRNSTHLVRLAVDLLVAISRCWREEGLVLDACDRSEGNHVVAISERRRCCSRFSTDAQGMSLVPCAVDHVWCSLVLDFCSSNREGLV
jgi:hypothetical protein